MKSLALVAVPDGVWTVTFPELTTLGVTAPIVVAVAEVTFSTVGPILTVSLAVFMKKLAPLIVSGAPLDAKAGLMELMVGPVGAVSTVNAAPLVAVPFEFCTLIVPVVAPAGTVVKIWVLL